MKLFWNAIVKNEGARIERCVKSLLPQIAGAIIVDTGSTDDTLVKLTSLFKEAGKPLEIGHAPFENFEQARNQALKLARASKLPWDYLLLCDADMELVVRKGEWDVGLTAPGYNMKQFAGGTIGYFNMRLVSKDATGKYRGVTHEYLDVAGPIIPEDAAYFVDHADGANRPDKYKRDIDLLTKALATEKDPGLVQRYTFYLAQSYFDGGEWGTAAAFYKRRVELGGWDEEVWNAQVKYAYCLLKMDDEPAYVHHMLKAYEMRPSRAEALYDLARFYREKPDRQKTSLLFSTMGMKLKRPGDLLFVNEEVYRTGLREEFAICAGYDNKHRAEGAKVAAMLSLEGSQQARGNLYWYLEPLKTFVPSFTSEKYSFTPPAGYKAMNPSVFVDEDGRARTLVRTVNYSIVDGRYMINNEDGSVSEFDHPIKTRNFIDRRDGGWEEILMPSENWPMEWDLVHGFEDSRLFKWRGDFWTLSTVRQLNREGWCEQVLAPLVNENGRWRYGNNWKRILPEHRRNEKNWMPWVEGNDLRFVYRLGALIDTDGKFVVDHPQQWDVGNVSGGSQVVDIGEGRKLAIVHEAGQIPGQPKRYYRHRFALFREDKNLHALSHPFCFHAKEIEFAAGLGYLPDSKEIVISYGVRDCEARLAIMDADEVVRFTLED